MNTIAGSCAGNWFRCSRGKIGRGGARCLFTTKRDSHSSSHYRWEVAYTNVTLNYCFGASSISILRRPVISSLSPIWIQTKNFYVVRKGRIPGIYDNWEDCKSQVQGFQDNEYKKFSSRIEAKEYLAAHGINSTRYITKKAFVKDPKHGQDAYNNQPEEPLVKATKSKRSRKKLGATESNEELSKDSSVINKPLGNSSKSARSRKEVDAAGSNKVEEPLVKGTKSKRSRKKLDERESNEKFPKASSQQTKQLGNSSKSTRSRKEVDAADSNVDLLQASFQPTEPLAKANIFKITKKTLDETQSNEDLLQAFSQPEEPLAKANRSKRPRKKLDDTESIEELCIVTSQLDKPLGNFSKSGRSRKQVGAADSNEDALQASSQLEEPPTKMIKSKRTRKKLDETESNEELLGASSSLNQALGSSSKSTRTKKKAGAEYSDKDSSEVSSLVDPVVKFAKSRKSKTIGVTSSNKDLVQVSKKPLEKITKSKNDGKKLVATDSVKVEEPLVKGTKTKRSRKKLDETESKEKFPIASSRQTKQLGYSSKSTRSRKEIDAADSNVDLMQASFQPTEPLAKANILKRTKKTLDETQSNEDLLQAFSQPEEPLAKANRSKRPRKKLDEIEFIEELCIVTSQLDEPLGNFSKSGRSRKQVGAADSNEDALQASSQLEEPPAKMIKSKRTRKKLDETESNEELLGASSSLNQPLGSSSKSTRTKKKAGAEYSDKDSSEVSSLVDPVVKFAKSRKSKKIGVTSSNKDLVQVSKKPLENITKSKKDGKKLVATDSVKVIYHLEFDGASKGNPGKAGAGALLRSQDGKVVYELREGVGYATNNVAEYRAVILGLKVALSYGISKIHVKGDSKLVCKQIQGLWKTQNENMAKLCGEAKQLKAKFKKFHIRHIEREFNSKADSLANAAINLRDGEWLSRKFELQGSSDASSLVEPPEKFANSRSSKKSGVVDCNKVCYQMEFDGASKGNPGRAGAGALLRNQDGKVLYELREGVGLATNNVAEYRAVILGMKVAVSQGISRIHVQGDSKLVCMQMQGLWKIKNENMAKLCAEAVRLKTKFKEFYIGHIDREFNSDADALANSAISLQDGEFLLSKVDAKGHSA